MGRERPGPWNALPRPALRDGPAPLVHLTRFSGAVGADVWAKRDVIGSVSFAGNKVRKLEFLLADAVRQEADVVVAIGARQSNFTRTVAASAARLGIPAVLILGMRPRGDLPRHLIGLTGS